MSTKLFPFWKLKKAPYYCPPAGEQITNGTFEPDATGWTFSSGASSLSTQRSHSPTHSIFSYSDAGGFYQDISNLNVACVQSLTFWALCPFGTGTVHIIIYYTDGSQTDIQFTHGNVWTQHDVTAQLDAGKTVNRVLFWTATDNPTFIDDVSLISTG